VERNVFAVGWEMILIYILIYESGNRTKDRRKTITRKGVTSVWCVIE
jgi:hypothetical protein